MSTFNRKRQIMEHQPKSTAQDEIIEMAIEAEFVSHGKPSDEESELFVCVDKDIYRFAKLVAAKEREKFCVLLRQFHDSISLASDPSTIKAKGES